MEKGESGTLTSTEETQLDPECEDPSTKRSFMSSNEA